MRYRLLGPLEVEDDDGPVRIRPGRESSLLALLLVHRGSALAPDRIIEELWPDRPPENAAKSVQVYVSRLRKALGAGRIDTTPAGYRIRLEDDELDLERFERLARDGEIDEALGLWRGEALTDFRYAPFAIAEARRLEELRDELTAALIDLRLARGETPIAELETTIRREPLWERPRGQLMRALYLAGRQADALELYRATRDLLSEELGVEPNPELQRLERAILNHDPALGTPAAPPSAIAARRGPLLLLAGGALVAAAAAALVLVLSHGDGGDHLSAAAPGQGEVVALDATSGAVRERVAAGRTPTAIAVGNGVVWVVDADARTVLRLSKSLHVLESFSTGATPTDVAVGAGAVWVTNGHALARAQFVGPVATAVARLDPATGNSRSNIGLPAPGGSVSNLVDNHVAIDHGAVWAVAPDFGIVKIDPATGAVTARSHAVQAVAVAAGPAGVWVLSADGAAVRLDPQTGRPVARANIPASSVGSIAVGKDAVWVTSPGEGTLWRVNAGGKSTVGAIGLSGGISDLAVGAGSVWVANPVEGTVLKVGIRSARLQRTIHLDSIPRSIAFAGGEVLVATVTDPRASATKVAGLHPFPASTCEHLIAGSRDADVLIVSDLPLQGGVNVTTTQMAEAVRYVLRAHEFRAGRFRIAYQSCDDSVAQTGLYDESKCAANARAYAASREVVAVIGTFNSPCAVAAVPELNLAEGGPLAMISPSNSFVGLTRAGPGVDPSLPAALYPTGRRNYLRVSPTDDLQGAALALLARDRHRRRVYVLDDGVPGYGGLMAIGFETAARRLGLVVVGHASWDPGADNYRELAERVGRSKAQAVFVGGLLDTNAAAVVRDLRSRLGRSVDLLAPDGLTPFGLFVQKGGDAALGTYVALAGAVTERLPPAGTRFVDQFARAHGGADVEPSTVYAAQATEVLLEAIARSNGTRSSVLDELFRAHVRDGLLGTFGFDANGDTTESPITIMRVARGGGKNSLESVEGGVVERVARPSPRLVAPIGKVGG
jgi:branched-chain amino acid transport system substrate-binding protein